MRLPSGEDPNERHVAAALYAAKGSANSTVSFRERFLPVGGPLYRGSSFAPEGSTKTHGVFAHSIAAMRRRVATFGGRFIDELGDKRCSYLA